MTVLVIGQHDDPHVDALVKALDARGDPPTTVLFGLGPDHWTMRWSHVEDSSLNRYPSLELNEIRLDQINEFDAVFYLPFAVNRPPTVPISSAGTELSEGEAEFAQREWETVIASAIMTCHREFRGPWITAPCAIDLQDRKPYLLDCAVRAGLDVPSFDIGQQFPEGLELLNGRVVGKAINAYQEIESGTYFNTSIIPDEFKQAVVSSRSSVPNFIQRYTRPDAEYRCYVAMGEILSVRIARTGDVEDPVDLRVVDKSRLTGSRSDLGAYANRLIAFTNTLGINYCAFDLIAERDSVFLVDINPIGGWYYIDVKYQIGVTDWLIDRVTRQK
jgi:hypothetical protein